MRTELQRTENKQTGEALITMSTCIVGFFFVWNIFFFFLLFFHHHHRRWAKGRNWTFWYLTNSQMHRTTMPSLTTSARPIPKPRTTGKVYRRFISQYPESDGPSARKATQPTDSPSELRARRSSPVGGAYRVSSKSWNRHTKNWISSLRLDQKGSFFYYE